MIEKKLESILTKKDELICSSIKFSIKFIRISIISLNGRIDYMDIYF